MYTSNAMYGLVQTGSPLATTDRARGAMEREQRRQRVQALERAGVHDPRERARILRAEDRHTDHGSLHGMQPKN